MGCDRRATKQMARRRPAPEGWAVWLSGVVARSLQTPEGYAPVAVWKHLAPSQTAKQPPAKSEFIFEQTLNETRLHFGAHAVSLFLPFYWVTGIGVGLLGVAMVACAIALYGKGGRDAV